MLQKAEGDFLKNINRDIPVVNLHASGSLGLFFALTGYFKKEKPDIFVSAFARINVICVLAKIWSRVGTKVVITEHSVFSFLPVIAKTPLRRLFARFFMPNIARFVYPKADAIICVSQGIADDLKKIITSRDMRVIYNPIISDDIFRLAEEVVGHPWFTNKNVPVIVAAGRLVPCKDYPTLLKAFSLVLAKQPVRLVILGRGTEEHRLKKMADELGIVKNTDFLGFQENPFKYMAGASLFVLSSLQEGFGNVIIEAMACGAPVVSTDCPAGPGEIITQRVSGLLVPVGNPSALAESMLKVLHDSALAHMLSFAGKKRAQDFLVEKSVAEYQKVFAELL